MKYQHKNINYQPTNEINAIDVIQTACNKAIRVCKDTKEYISEIGIKNEKDNERIKNTEYIANMWLDRIPHLKTQENKTHIETNFRSNGKTYIDIDRNGKTIFYLKDEEYNRKLTKDKEHISPNEALFILLGFNPQALHKEYQDNIIFGNGKECLPSFNIDNILLKTEWFADIQDKFPSNTIHQRHFLDWATKRQLLIRIKPSNIEKHNKVRKIQKKDRMKVVKKYMQGFPKLNDITLARKILKEHPELGSLETIRKDVPNVKKQLINKQK